MKRRHFIAASSLAVAAAGVTSAAGAETGQQYLELRQYHMLLGEKQNLLKNFLRDAAIPAWNRLGIGPVGVFTLMFGQSRPTLYVLLPHDSVESVVTARARLAEDSEYKKVGAAVLDASLSDPAYVRMESSLLRAFKGMPSVEVPPAVRGKNTRVFEMRTYESHSDKAAIKKIEMFNDAGEIAIFQETGLNPVFFGESLIGPQLPNLTYMLAFENMEKRSEAWDAFRESLGWQKLRVDPQYKDTVSNISDVILRPEACSQI